MRFMNDWHQKRQRKQIPRISSDTQPWHVPVRERMENAHLDRRPDWQARSKRAHHAVEVLPFEKERPAPLLGRPFGIVLEAIALGAPDIVPQLERAVEEEHRNAIGDE